MLSNINYTEKFAYIPSNSKNRSDLIGDGNITIKNKCEQSDMVNLILNLALIEDVNKKVFSFEQGFSD